MMWAVICEIRRRGIMSGAAVSAFCHGLGRPDKSAGGCLARALEYGHIRIAGTVIVGKNTYNLYQ